MSTAETEELIKFVGIDDTQEMRNVRTILEKNGVEVNGRVIAQIIQILSPANLVQPGNCADLLSESICYLINRFGIDNFKEAFAYYEELLNKNNAG